MTNQLARRYEEKKSPQQARGIQFEASIYSAAQAVVVNSGTDFFKEIVRECKGGVFQKKMRKMLIVDGVEYCLYGKADVWFSDVIKDIKTTNYFKGPEKYLGGFQHKLYCYMEHIPHFVYVVGVFEGESKALTAKYVIEYKVEDWTALEAEVINKVREVVMYLFADPDLRVLYDTKFSLY